MKWYRTLIRAMLALALLAGATLVIKYAWAASPAAGSAKCVFSTKNLKRYQFPTHINDLVMDRSEAKHSEVFMVIVPAHSAPPFHKHDDTEQIFYVLEGRGTLSIGDNRERHPVAPGDVVRVPMKTYHSIKSEDGKELKYLCVDCFGDSRLENEPTWDDHVKTLCREQGWDYKTVVRPPAP
jgi:mannose-6-phosphate isomerase-like protein (cupin superfamily)